MSKRLPQINLHHSKAASAALLPSLTEGGADLVLVQEPWIVEDKVEPSPRTGTLGCRKQGCWIRNKGIQAYA